MSENATGQTRLDLTPRLVWRWTGLVGLLGSELLLVTQRFDTGTLADRPGMLAKIVGFSPDVLSIALAFSGALLLMIGRRVPARVSEIARISEGHAWMPWVGLHLLSLCAFVVLSLLVFREDARAEPLGATSAVAWFLLAVAVLACWLLAMAPWRAWRAVLASERPAFAVSATVAVFGWAAGQATRMLWLPLADATFQVTHALLVLLYPEVVADAGERLLGTPDFQVTIAPSCSGYEGIGLVVVFIAAYLWLFRARLRFPAALALFPIGAVFVWLLNSIRIAALIAIGSSWSPDVALGGFHSQAGWLGFIAVALIVVALAHRLQLFSVASPQGHSTTSDQATLAAALLMPFIVLMAATMATAAASAMDGFPALYPLKIAATAAALWYFRRVYKALDWDWSWQAVAIGIGVFALWILLDPARATSSPAPDGLTALPTSLAIIWLAFRILGSAIVVPLTEELAFRGYLLRKLVASRFAGVAPDQLTPFAYLASSALFGLFHERWLAGTLAGLAYAYAMSREGRIGDAVLAHMTTNTLIAVSVLLFGQWALWM